MLPNPPVVRDMRAWVWERTPGSTRVILAFPAMVRDPALYREGCRLISFRTGRRDEGGLAPEEMLRTFNAGIGMVLAVAPDRAEALAAALMDAGERVIPLGQVTDAPGLVCAGRLE